ncbi:sulfurtransferase complex subunit TusC [Shewanella gaetbuli]|uniref:Sulfurtransferase complex subunit TusC n=1 Tax=Shewanella gaetbuli TaxID=220752 RepID=A0A9X1ZXV3_9GAMM|nr:sulfurtransferase complex subunit TusC [Shewanella gaetbuli]MCL1144156.1 sulfurtransferase complex subunit TusC [Shewanella gaetbuli]
MKHICVVFRHAPFGATSSREGIDFALLSASFEQQLCLVFTDEAVLHLLADQQPELAGSKDYVSVFKAFDLYDIEHVLVCETSLQRFGLTLEDLAISAQLASSTVITEQLQQADEVLVF